MMWLRGVMKELIELICQYDPSYPQKLRGVSSEELAELEQLAGRPLPARLKAFLRSMGKESGDLGSPWLWPRYERIRQFYQSERRLLLPPRYLFLATSGPPSRRDYFQDCGLLAEAEDCPIVQAPVDSPTGGPFAPGFPSLKDLVFWAAFQTKRMDALPFRVFLRPSDRSAGYGATETAAMILEDLEELMPRLGFRRLPHTSAQNPLFERGDAALAVHGSAAPWALCVVLAAAHERERTRLWDMLTHTTLLI
jgi:hypothetical protein